MLDHKVQRKAWLTLSQSRFHAVHVLRSRTSRDVILILFHSWKLHTSFRVKVHRVLHLLVRQHCLATATRMKRASIGAMITNVHAANRVRAVADGRSRSYLHRACCWSFGAWRVLAEAYRRNRQKGSRIMSARRTTLMSIAFADWLMSVQSARNIMQRNRIKCNIEERVTQNPFSFAFLF